MRAHMPEKPMEDIENQQKEVQKEVQRSFEADPPHHLI